MLTLSFMFRTSIALLLLHASFNMAEYPPYKHEGVYNNSIRLLHLDKNDAILDGKSTLQGSLRSVSLARPGSFDAISYACEGQKETEYILIDGQRLGITINCRDGLQYLRSTHGVRTIWVDAICIAPDKTDKSRQIPLMTDIYGKAQTVYIWLGTRHPDGLSERGLDWIQAVSLGQDTLLGIRQAQFPKNLLPREIAKAIIIISRVVKASKCLLLLRIIDAGLTSWCRARSATSQCHPAPG